jgi:hypothetical protein
VKPNSRWTVEDGTFNKIFPDQFDESLDKCQRLHVVASSNGFIAPYVLDADKKTGIVRFEYIDEFTSIRKAYIEYMAAPVPDHENLELIHQAGMVLGAIHSDMNLETRDEWSQPLHVEDITRRWLGKGGYPDLLDTPYAYIHGDYGFSNINITGSGNKAKLAIIDPCPNNYFTFRVNSFASVYIDLATFVSCLDGRVPVGYYRSFKWRRLRTIKEAFLDAYEGRTGYVISRCLLACLSCAVTESYFLRKYGGGLRSFIAHKVVHNALKHNVPSSCCIKTTGNR